ncbi:hypothetical protein E0Z10_g4699 [Xylaria hypoxylon]|uniref:Ubiquitin-like domain-containing protein n=1 Tax=Xylaria hypoxylon TaxID=37992 RepID=A0A4Z0YY31_9PEZI|nr:hypothetical protein E0Z10_g4699 [Xylaria hypoxylon]
MADLQKPAPAKRALPFKRTARQKPPSDASSRVDDDDGLSLFSQSKNYFSTVVEDQQRRAREKAEKAEQERKEKLAREREEVESKAREAQLRCEKRRKEAGQEEKESESAKKRRPNPFLPEDERQQCDDEEDDDVFGDKPRNFYKLSAPLSPEMRRDASAPRSSRPESSHATRTLRQPETPVVLLDSSDDEDPTKRGSKAVPTAARMQSGRGQTAALHIDLKESKAKADDSDSDLEMLEEKTESPKGAEGEEEDPSEYYIKAAMERMRKAKEARLARESSGVGDGGMNKSVTPGIDDGRGAPVSVMIAAPALPEAKALCCTVRTEQALQIAFDTFKERQKRQTAYPHKLISELVFTWRGDRVYYTTKLETLGIHPRGQDGRLHDNTSSGRNGREGYVGKDKVYFEAWTPEDYEENQKKQERERKRRELGEWWDEDDAANGEGDSNDGQTAEAEANTPQEDDRVKVIFKARDMPPRNVTLRKYSTVAHMIKAFRKLTGLGEDKHVEIRWDGEVLDPETTVEEADIADMDSVEVHVR